MSRTQTIQRQMEELLPPATLKLLRAAGATAQHRGLPLYLVGGSVRDLLMGRPVLDLDLVVEGDAAHLAGTLARELSGTVAARSQFGTVKLKVGDLSLDLATARRESYAHPGALPTVQPGSLQDDLARRDFTINAMAAELASQGFGRLLDSFGGQRDLRQRSLRVLHERSFVDDATRILRAIRYEQRLGCRMASETEALARRDKGYLEAISGDRLRHELERLFQEPQPENGLARAGELSALDQLIPGLAWPEATHHLLASWRSQGEPAPPLLFLALLAGPLSPEQGEALAVRLNVPARWRRIVRDTVTLRGRLPALAAADLKPSRAFGLLRDLEPLAVLAWVVLAQEPQVRGRLLAHWSEWRHVRTHLRGDDLLALGVLPGPQVGQVLEALLQARLDGLVSSREDEERLVRRSVAGSSYDLPLP